MSEPTDDWLRAKRRLGWLAVKHLESIEYSVDVLLLAEVKCSCRSISLDL